MEVVLLLAVAFLAAATFTLHRRNVKLSINESELSDYLNRALEDHKAGQHELAIVSSKLQALKESTLTPDNAITKDSHISQMVEKSEKISELQSQLSEVTAQFESLRGKQISERVRLGYVSENFAAFLSEFPYDRSKVRALFQPIDLIYFGEDEIVFIDVKSGDAHLSSKQRNIKKLVEDGKVRFEVHRINEDGYDIK